MGASVGARSDAWCHDVSAGSHKERLTMSWANVKIQCLGCGHVREEKLWGVRRDEGRVLPVPVCSKCPDDNNEDD